ncbi:MAG: hypothetical protein N3F07_01005 [Candidatus Micrarchaeota archaeon]|nr:hypothetical protein [Candidatus Micrarchaeota archaeon]
MELKEAVGFAAAIATTLGFLPKTYHVWKSRSAKNIEWWLIGVFWLDVALWFAYGMLIASKPTLAASGLIGILVGCITAAKLKFG